MSLTSFLQLPEVKERFRQEFEMPKLSSVEQILAPPQFSRYSLVGTAFDYVLRFPLQRTNKNAIHQSWVAEEGVHILAQRPLRKASYDIEEELHSFPDQNSQYQKARLLLDEARVQVDQYVSSGKLTDKLVESSIHLAQLDVVYRAGFVDENLGVAYQEDIQDLRNLVKIVPQKLFLAKNLCLLNPTFGKASTLVAGADADVFIDEMLVDIKTTKNLRLERDNFHQLLGYLALHTIDGIGSLRPKPAINKMAIYFSRHAHLEVFDSREITKQRDFPEFIRWFSDYAKQVFGKQAKRRSTTDRKRKQ